MMNSKVGSVAILIDRSGGAASFSADDIYRVEYADDMFVVKLTTFYDDDEEETETERDEFVGHQLIWATSQAEALEIIDQWRKTYQLLKSLKNIFETKIASFSSPINHF